MYKKVFNFTEGGNSYYSGVLYIDKTYQKNISEGYYLGVYIQKSDSSMMVRNERFNSRTVNSLIKLGVLKKVIINGDCKIIALNKIDYKKHGYAKEVGAKI